MIDWQQIDTVLLDMDGTLLDLHFDNHFWLEYVPQRYAAMHAIDPDMARHQLLARYQDIQGTLNWYCVDHWSRELGLDIALLKEEVDHLIQIHPHVPEFLELLARAGKRRVLVTNAHQKALELKMRRTQLRDLLDHVVCAHDLGLPKEAAGFWARLQREEAFNPERTLFVDDSLAVLRAAHAYGIRHLLAILLPDTRQAERQIDEFDAIRDFSALLPDLRAAVSAAGFQPFADGRPSR